MHRKYKIKILGELKNIQLYTWESGRKNALWLEKAPPPKKRGDGDCTADEELNKQNCPTAQWFPVLRR